MLIITRFTDNSVGKYVSQMRMPGYERENRNVLRRCLKTASDGALQVRRPGMEVPCVQTPETGKARLPTIARRTGGTARRWEAEDRSRCFDGETSETRLRLQLSNLSAVDGSVRQDDKLIGDALTNTQPMKIDQLICDILLASDPENKPYSSVMNGLDAFDVASRKS